MAIGPARTKGTGKAGHRSSRWMARALAKAAARKHRRADDKREART